MIGDFVLPQCAIPARSLLLGKHSVPQSPPVLVWFCNVRFASLMLRIMLKIMLNYNKNHSVHASPCTDLTVLHRCFDILP